VKDLIGAFEAYNTDVLDPYRELISTKSENGEIFPPYIPHVGDDFDKYGILMYGMAQNVSTPWEYLSNKSRQQKVRQMFDAAEYGDIWIAPYKVMLALGGLYIYAKFGDALSDFQKIHQSIAVTNYYKFSLHQEADVNPDQKLSDYQCPQLYWSENDKLSNKELKALKPKTLISFNGRHNEILKNCGSEFIKINDPSWILQGGSGQLKETGSWYRECSDDSVLKLIESYLSQIDDKYSSKKEALRIYLLKYYNDWV